MAALEEAEVAAASEGGSAKLRDRAAEEEEEEAEVGGRGAAGTKSGTEEGSAQSLDIAQVLSTLN